MSKLEQAGRLDRAESKLGASWSKGNELEQAGSKLEQAGRLERAGSKLEQGEQAGVSWEAGESWEQAGSELEQGEQLAATLPIAPQRLQGPRDALGARGASWEQGEPAGGFLRPMVVGTLKPSITFVSHPSLQLAPSSLPGASHLVKLSLPDILIFACAFIGMVS